MVKTTVDESFEHGSGQNYNSLSCEWMVAYEAIKKFTQIHTLLHFITHSHITHPLQRGLYAH